ncbi:MAG: patatin-like phospholipase family protein [Rhodospirillales bacterium]|nr:patatin-like phospholipase family protein [Rhodospirillales bacterium]
MPDERLGARPDEGTASSTSAAAATKTINLALQGGGAHGAFAWGVLDRLFEDERIAIEGLSATSAGAMNAVVAAHGFTAGGRAGARQALDDFWRAISETAWPGSWWPDFGRLAGYRAAPSHFAIGLLARLFSPYQFNPLDINPLRDLIERTVDFAALRAQCPIKLFLCATNVRSGKVKIFGNRELSAAAVLASGCLPHLFQAVEVDGAHYWDGGYMGNPAIFPLIYHCDCRDVVVIHINPIERDELPTTPDEIMNRLNEISFNSSLMREMRAIAFVSKLIDSGDVRDNALHRVLIHAIDAEEFMRDLGAASKFDPNWSFLTRLRDIGRERAGEWIERNFARLGVESTIDIRAKYL